MSAGPFRPKIALVCGRFGADGGAMNICEVKAGFGGVGQLSYSVRSSQRLVPTLLRPDYTKRTPEGTIE
jgi:hypothetical protein